MKALIDFLKCICQQVGALVVIAAVAVSIWLLAGLNGRLDMNNKLLMYQIQQLEQITKRQGV